MNKKLIIGGGIIGIIILMFVPALLGIGQKSTNQKANNSTQDLKIWSLSDTKDNKGIQLALDNWHKTHKKSQITEFRSFSNPAIYEQELLKALATNTGPDIFNIPNTELGFWRSQISPAPENLISTKTFRNFFVQGIHSQLIFPDPQDQKNTQDRIWGIPIAVNPLLIMYNKSIMSNYYQGYTPAPVWISNNNQASLLGQIKQITKHQGSNWQKIGLAIGGGSNITNSFAIFLAMLTTKNIQVSDGQKITLTNLNNGKKSTQLATQIFNFYRNFANANNQANSVWTWDKKLLQNNTVISDDSWSFGTGLLAMRFTFAGEFIHMPKLLAKIKNSINTRQIKFAPFPQDTINTKFTIIKFSPYLVNKNSPNTTLAWQFLDGLSNPQVMTKYAKYTQLAPAGAPVANQLAHGSNKLAITAAAALTARPITLTGNLVPYQEAFNKIIATNADFTTLKKTWQCILDRNNSKAPAEKICY